MTAFENRFLPLVKYLKNTETIFGQLSKKHQISLARKGIVFTSR